MVVNATLDQTQATLGVVPTFPAFVGAANQSTTAIRQVSGTNNVAPGTYAQYVQEFVDASGAVQTVGAAARNFVRYAEYPGQRLFRKVKFETSNLKAASKDIC
jgi:hypothetical protein